MVEWEREVKFMGILILLGMVVRVGMVWVVVSVCNFGLVWWGLGVFY